jgi:hypothetical protein
VASARPVKHSKKAMFHLVVIATAAGMVVGASGSKVVAGTKKLWCLLINVMFLLSVLWWRRP